MTAEGRLFIAGKFVTSTTSGTFQAINPATEQPICSVAIADIDDVNMAVASSRKAQVAWQALDARERGQLMYQIAATIDDHGADLASLDSLNSGRPIVDCREDIHAASGMFRHFAGICDKIAGQTLPVQNDKLCFTKREPYGVIAAITAWNYPLFNASAKIAPVIATGNACILKPAEEAPLTALLLASLISDIEGIPEGLVTVLNGPGELTGELLTRHSGVAKVTFTGSTETGRKILHASADSNLKGVTLELGGKSPFVIFADADIEMALNGIVFSVFFNQGQTCTAGTRLLVERSILPTVIDGLKDRIARIQIGSPDSEDTSVGPLISLSQYEKVMGYLDRAKRSGTTLICGGGRPKGIERGYFVEPTVFLDPPIDSELVQDEIFGPVLVVHTFGTDDEAVLNANRSEFGLAASVWTRDSRRLLAFADKVEAGIVWCNTVFNEHPGAPAGGYKQSGFGREYGVGAIEEYTRIKTIWVDLSGDSFAWV